MRNRKAYFIVLLIFAIIILSPQVVYAKEFTNEQSGVDIIFVMDYSGSMKTNDSQNIAKGMVKSFIDTVPSESVRIGFISYNDQILSSISPIAVKTQEQRDKLKSFIDAKAYSGNTDIGLGLKFAYDIMEQETERKKIIVLISDGETDLKGSKTGRDIEISEKDRRDTIEKCKEAGTKRAIELKTSGPFHTSKLKDASEALKKELEPIEIRNFNTKVIKNIDGKPYVAQDNVKQILTNHIINPVRFAEGLQTMIDMGIDTFVEIGPGKTLAGFVKRTSKDVRIFNINDVDSLENTIGGLKNE